MKILEKHFNKIIVTCDEKIFHAEQYHSFNESLKSKTIYVGYISKPVSQAQIKQIRNERGINNENKWIVCSSGGGKYGESLINESIKIAKCFKNIQFDIIHGAKSKESWHSLVYDFVIKKNIRYLKFSTCLPFLHASADIVICHGGYNSIVESIEGDSYIICIPNKGDQFINPKLFAKYHKILYSDSEQNLKSLVEYALSDLDNKKNAKHHLNFYGLKNIKNHLVRDL